MKKGGPRNGMGSAKHTGPEEALRRVRRWAKKVRAEAEKLVDEARAIIDDPENSVLPGGASDAMDQEMWNEAVIRTIDELDRTIKGEKETDSDA